jgi:hypothetical protein
MSPLALAVPSPIQIRYLIFRLMRAVGGYDGEDSTLIR